MITVHDKPCWLRDGCKSQTAACSSTWPEDDGCPVYRHFRDLFRKEKTVRPEYEGDARSSWWYVCEECHTRIETTDHFCRQCGGRIIW